MCGGVISRGIGFGSQLSQLTHFPLIIFFFLLLEARDFFQGDFLPHSPGGWFLCNSVFFDYKVIVKGL